MGTGERSSTLTLAVLAGVLIFFGQTTSYMVNFSENINAESPNGSLSGPLPNEAQGWSLDFILSDPVFSLAKAPSMAVHGPNIHVVWEDWRMVPEGRAFEVFHKRSTDNGVTWSVGKMLSDDDIECSGSPQVAVENDNVFVVWSDCRGFSVSELYYVISSDNGETWSENKALTSDDGFSSEWPLITMADSLVHVVWGDDRDGQYEVYYRKSTDGGATWSEVRRLTNWTVGTDAPHGIDVDGFYVHVLITRYVGNWESFYLKSDDGGSTWSSSVPVADLDGHNSEGCTLSSFDSMVHVGLVDWKSGPREIYYRNSTDNGTTWNLDVRISNSSFEAGQCDVAISPPNVHFVWYDEKPGNSEVFYRNSTDMGVTWEEEVRLTYASGISAQPNIGLNENYIHVVWLDKRYGDPKILYKRHPDYGSDTTPPQAPTFLSASLTNNTRDVQIHWGYSPDEGSVGGTVRYAVLRSDMIEGPYVLLAEVNASSSPSYSWTNRGTGEGNPNDYFYCVCAVDMGNNTACAEERAGKFIRSLNKGPHLLSIPLVQSNESVETVLQTVRFDKAWSYDSFSQKWNSYMAFKTYGGNLWTVNHTMGLWINVTVESNLTVAGMVPLNTGIRLLVGWNLVGFPSFNSSVTVSDVLLQSGATGIEGFDATSPPHFLKGLHPEEPMVTSDGYWLYVESESTWILSY